jgi:hypothetical protein
MKEGLELELRGALSKGLNFVSRNVLLRKETSRVRGRGRGCGREGHGWLGGSDGGFEVNLSCLCGSVVESRTIPHPDDLLCEYC